MLALVADPPSASLQEVDEPEAAPGRALVEVRAFSLNRGETVRLATMQRGEVTGWDVAGVVGEAAPDGTGPPAGARVVGLVGRGAWAQRCAVPVTHLAELPDGVSFEQAATLPVAGLTALEGLALGGSLIGRSVLITGASGGVGRFAIQIAARSGARVTAVARRQEGLAQLGADRVAQDIPEEEFDVILDAVGGPTLGRAIAHVASDGTVVSFASTVAEPVSYPTRELFGRAPGATVHGFLLFHALRDGTRSLRRLAELVAAGVIDCQIDRVQSWREAGPVIEDLLERRIAGKAVLTVD